MTLKDWLRNENNPILPKSEYLYGTRHIVLLILTILFCFGVYFLLRKSSDKSKNIFLYVCASVLLFFEITSRIVNLVIANTYTLTTISQIILPMHMCSVMVWIFIIGIFSKNKFLLRYSAIMGLLSTLVFLLYPAVGINQKYMAFTNIYSTFSHMLGFILCVSLMSLRIVDFRFKKIWQPYVCATIMFAYGYLLNWVIFPGSDYMYMRNDPLGLGLNYPHQYLYSSILIVYIFTFYFVNLFTRRKESKIPLTLEEPIENNDELSKEESIVLSIMSKNPKVTRKVICLEKS